jgi:hypothetical protein
VGLDRRHALFGIITQDAMNERTGLDVACNNGGNTIAFGERIVFEVESQAALALLAIRTVTLKAMVGQDRADVAVEVDQRITKSRLRRRVRRQQHSEGAGS